MTQRTFLVTGASKGIGRAISEQLVEEGHQVVGIARQAGDASFPGELIATDLSDSVAAVFDDWGQVATHGNTVERMFPPCIPEKQNP